MSKISLFSLLVTIQSSLKFLKEEQQSIKQTLGKTALKVEHVGPTSTLGLCAKLVIDILLVVSASSKDNRYLLQLEGCVFVNWSLKSTGCLLEKSINCICMYISLDSQEARDLIIFRDWLLVNESERLKYQ